MTKDAEPLQSYAKAEAYLNSTLAYQAAIAVHHLRETFGLSVSELCLSVASDVPSYPHVALVTCTITSLQDSGKEPKGRFDSARGQDGDGHSIENQAD